MENSDRQLVAVDRTSHAGNMQAFRSQHASKGAQDLQKLHRLMRGKYLAAILLSVALGAGGAYLGFSSGGKTYQSTGLLRVNPVLPKILYPTENNSMLPEFDAFVDAQVALLKSQRVLDQAMDDQRWLDLVNSRKINESAESFAKDLDIQRQGGMIVIKATHADPMVARMMTDVTMDVYQKLNKQREEQEQKQPQVERKSVEEANKSRLDDLDKQKSKYTEKYHTDDLKSLFHAKAMQVDSYEAMLQELKSMRKSAATTTQPTDNPELSDDAIAVVDGRMADLLATVRQDEKILAGLKAKGYLDNYRDVVQTRAMLVAAREEARKYADDYRAMPHHADDSANSSLRRQDEQIAEFTNLKEHAYQEMKELGDSEIALQKLENEEIAIRQEYNEAKQKWDQWNLESRITGRVEELSPADRPYSPHRDTRLPFAGAGLFGGIVVGFGSMLLLGLFNRRLNRPDDADGGLYHFAMLGVLPTLPDDLADAEQAALASHCVHLIRTRLQIEAQDIQKPVFAVTSPVAGTGKTSLTLALGVSFAAARLRTLLVDCDLVGGGLTAKCDVIVRRKIGQILHREGLITEAQLNEALELAHGSRRRLGEILVELGYLKESDIDHAVITQDGEPIGVLDALSGEDLESCVTSTGVDGLSVLPLGNATAQHVGRLAPDVFRQLVERCRANYDVVLIDTGPVPGSLEASVVASQVDEVILTVARGEQRALAEKSAMHLSALGARVAGIVFNRARNEDVDLYGSSNFISEIPAGGIPNQSARGISDPLESSGLGPIADAVASSDATSQLGGKTN